MNLQHKTLYDIDKAFEEENNQDLDKYYEKRFSDKITIARVEDKELQMRGVDVILTSTRGTQLCIDEKKRRKYYPDLLIEKYSSREYKTAGWTAKLFRKESLTDIIAVFFMDARLVYWVNVETLKSWIKEHRHELGTKYKAIPGPLQRYKDTDIFISSLNYAIPWSELKISPQKF